MAPLLQLAAAIPGVGVRVVLNPNPKVTELPLQRYYRTVLPALTFDSVTGAALPGPMAVFAGLPAAPLLTLGVQAPSAWMVQAGRAAADLDNIRLEDHPAGVAASYSLECVVVYFYV